MKTPNFKTPLFYSIADVFSGDDDSVELMRFEQDFLGYHTHILLQELYEDNEQIIIKTVGVYDNLKNFINRLKPLFGRLPFDIKATFDYQKHQRLTITSPHGNFIATFTRLNQEDGDINECITFKR